MLDGPAGIPGAACAALLLLRRRRRQALGASVMPSQQEGWWPCCPVCVAVRSDVAICVHSSHCTCTDPDAFGSRAAAGRHASVCELAHDGLLSRTGQQQQAAHIAYGLLN